MKLTTMDIYQYAKEHGIEMHDGEKYGTIYQRIIDSDKRMHNIDEIHNLANELLNKLEQEYDFKAVSVFASYPLIATKGYCGFDAVDMYSEIHQAMGYISEAFCKINKITVSLDIKMLEHEFQKVYREKYGFIHETSRLNELLSMIYEHGFDSQYISYIEDDLKYALMQAHDNYFINKDLTKKENIILLHEIYGIFFAHVFGFRDDVFYRYDGYGHVVSDDDDTHILNDFSIYI